ncbi:MAG: carboxylesterase family protein [Muribaculaceae bacterium]|nr:carboxylesterase family protein [Muribaculaceae bacterium]
MKKSKIIITSMLALCIAGGVETAEAKSYEKLAFNPKEAKQAVLTIPSGEKVVYTAYENIFYVTNVEDSVYQTLNIYVPETLRNGDATPILIRTYIGGYMATTAKSPSASDATGRALKEGYVVCIPGSRGVNSTIDSNGKTIYTGTAPNGLLDLKAAIRYLRYNDAGIPGNAEKIIIDGTSAGGAMSALVGSTGDRPEYDKYLRKMGAAPTSDKVFAAVCYCPITDLNHADMEYEWLYGCTNTGVRHLDADQITISNELAAECPAYINSLSLRNGSGNMITADNYKDYLKTFLIASAQKALEEGCEIPDTIGIIRYSEKPDLGDFPVRGGNDDGRGAPSYGPPGMRPMFNNKTDYVTDIDLDRYLSYVATVTPLKTPPAFDQYGVLIDTPTPENKVFGNEEGVPSNFTEFSLRHRLHDNAATLGKDLTARIYIMNPMNFISENARSVAPHWFIRHGAKDRDTSFLVPINLATKLKNSGFDVNFFLPWNRPHSGDYNLDDLFCWIDSISE